MPSLLDHFDGPKAVPFSYSIGSLDVAYPETINATFNGAGASGDFLACLDILSQDGRLLSRTFPGRQVTAGDTAEVTYAPFLRDGVGLTSIFYDILNVGGWLSVETTTTDPSAFGGGVTFNVGAGDFNVFALAGQVYIDGSATSIFSEDSDMVIDSHQDIQIFARGGGANIWDITGSLAIQTGAGFDISLTAGQALTVRDGSGNAIFRVDEDGDLHGKTGKALTFDL